MYMYAVYTVEPLIMNPPRSEKTALIMNLFLCTIAYSSIYLSIKRIMKNIGCPSLFGSSTIMLVILCVCLNVLVIVPCVSLYWLSGLCSLDVCCRIWQCLWTGSQSWWRILCSSWPHCTAHRRTLDTLITHMHHHNHCTNSYPPW